MFKELIEAFTILAKYSDEDFLLGTEHDVIYVYVNPESISKEDIERLGELGFFADFDDLECLYYYV